jgi:pimeloyl-ACP methyl ester carboxylesterase
LIKEDDDQAVGIHLIILVHGFQGSSKDLKELRNNLAVFHPEALFLCSIANEGKTEGDIEEMGIRLAKEVTEYIKEWELEQTLGALSFVGHSLGGVIIRAALPHLRQCKDIMKTLVTLSSPHLGYMYASNSVINAGMWVLTRLSKSRCLEQLSMTDAGDFKESFLYKLSLETGMGWFKNVLLVGSYQDSYVPVESARIGLMHKAIEDPK